MLFRLTPRQNFCKGYKRCYEIINGEKYLNGFRSGGDSWTRTNDPIDVNDVLSRFFFDTQPLYKCHIWFCCFNDNKSLHTDKSFVYIVNDARKPCFYNTK